MSPRLSFAHTVLWYGDAWYRRAWYAAPQLVAVALAIWILTPPASSPPAPAAGGTPAPWAVPVPQGDPGVAADALRDRAKTDSAAFEDLKARANAGDVNMQFSLGTLYDPNFRFSKLVAPDMPTAMRYYRMAADQGHVVGMLNYGYYQATGNSGTPRDPPGGFAWVLKAANNNLAQAQRVLGNFYRDGTGVTPDQATSYSWFQKAADAGDHPAEAEIGAAYWNGTASYRKDPAEAVKWFLKAAADKTLPYPPRLLGIAYRDGQGVPPDRATSLQWFRQAADINDAYAAAEIAFAYTEGTPPYPVNPVEAFKWLGIAAAAPSESGAQRLLGLAYRDGRGTPQDVAKARYWLQQAASHGDAEAARLVGTGR